MSRDGAIIGVSDHAGWAVLVTVAGDGTLLDRRRLDLLDEGERREQAHEAKRDREADERRPHEASGGVPRARLRGLLRGWTLLNLQSGAILARRRVRP